jgi:hypothetical protein
MDDHRRHSTGGPIVTQELIDEVSHALEIKPPKPRDGNGGSGVRWHYIGAILAALLAASALVGGLGRAFYVDKDDYVNSERTNAVEHEKIGQTLVRIDQSLNAQTAAFNRLQETVQAQAVELARLHK